MKQTVLAFLSGTILLFSCKKEELPGENNTSVKTTEATILKQSKRMNCEPFYFGILTMDDGNISTLNMNIRGDMAISQHANGLLNTNLFLDGACYKHSNAGSFLYTLNTLAGSLFTQTDQDVDWKIEQGNQNAITLSALYASLTPNVSYSNLNNNTTVTVNATTEKPNTILSVSNFNMNGKTLTLIGRPSSDDGFIINVSGNFSFSGSEIKLVDVRPERVLFNFPNATNVQIKTGSKFKGTVLCPVGTVDYQSPESFEGSIISKKLNATANLLSIANPTFIQRTYCNGYQWEGDNICDPTEAEVNLIAGQSINAGTVKVKNDGVNVTVTYNTNGGWKMTGVHLYAGPIENVPVTSTGNPIPGQFPYAATFSQNVSNYSIVIPVSSLPDCFMIAAHASLKKGNQVETGWGQGSQFSGNNWGMFFSYCKLTCM